MSTPLVDKDHINVGIIGLTPGNGHPYSWSAIFNGYDREKMTAECPYAAIPAYLNRQPAHTIGVAGISVTHISCRGEGEFTARHVAECSRIPNVVDEPEQMIPEIDAAIIATDIGSEHLERCRPFVEAGLPVFIDKPMTDNLADLKEFSRWIGQGRAILSSSAMRYTKEFMPYRTSTQELGEIKFANVTTVKWWETYGIHALEAVYPILGPGFLTCRNTGAKDRNIVHFTHQSGTDVVVTVINSMTGGHGLLTLCGTEDSVQLRSRDTFFAFKSQLLAFADYLRTGSRPFPYAETEELMRMVIAGTMSREAGGSLIDLDTIGATI